MNSEVGRAKEEATKQIPAIEQTIKELQGKKKLVGMDRTNVPYNEEIDSQIAALQGQIDSTRQQAADMNDILISAMPEEDRKLLEKYAQGKQGRAGREASVSMSGGVPLPWLENLFGGTKSDEYSALKKYGEDNLDLWAETLIRQNNAQEVQQMQEAGVKAGAEHPILGSLLSIPTNVMAGATSVLGRAAEVRTRTGQYPTLDPNNPYNIGTYGSSIQGQVASDIEGEDPNFWRKAGSYAYRGGMSALESGLRAGTGKAGTVLLSGLGSFEQNVAKASAQGASPEKAVALGLTNATIEALSEEIPLDNLLDAAKGGKQTFKQALKLALAQAGIEATTEEVSLIGSTLAEAAILQEKSEFNQYIQSRMAEGVDYHTAWDEAFQNLLGEAVDTAIVSAVSGGGMSGVNSLVTNYEANKQAKNQPANQQPLKNASAETGPQPQQESAQAPGTPLQGEAADPRQLAQQQEQARESTQAMEQEQQAQAAQQEAPQAPPATDPMLEGIQTPVAPTQEQPQQAAPGREPLDRVIAETLGQNQDQQQTPAAVDTPQEAVKPANAALDKVTNATIAEGSVKSQIRRSQETLNAMDAVAEIQTPSQFSAMDKSQKINWVVDKLKPTNYEVDRKGFGVIKFAKKQLKSAFNYFANGGAEEATFEAIPYVLQNGVEISSHADHKGRDYGTVTFAAPVIVDGQRGNMAVVVKQTTDNTYKVHRILTPDGSVFNLSDTKVEAEPTPAGESPKNGSLATPISSASDISIPTVGENVNGNMENSVDSSDVKSPYRDDMTEDEFIDAMTDQAIANDPRRGIADPMADRDSANVGSRKVKAYQYENPEVKPFFAEEALQMSAELNDSQKAERWYNDDVYYESGGEAGFGGTKRFTSDSIATLLDDYGLSYDQIQRGLFDIINDQGAENNAAAKRIELVLNDRLLNGYKDFYTGKQVPPNQGYLDMLRSKQSGPDTAEATTPAQSADPNSPGIKGTGAAEWDFSGKAGYYEFLSDENSQPDRPGDVRPMEVLRTDPYGRRVSDFAANAYAAPVTSDPMADRIQSLIQDDALGFDRQNSEEALQSAGKYIKDNGKGRTKNEIIKDVSRGIVKDGDIEKAMLLYAEYANGRGKTSLEDASEMMVSLTMMANKSGRNLNLFKLFRRMTPEGQLMTVQKTVQNQIDSLNRKRGKKHQIQDVQIPQELQQQYLDLAQKSQSQEDLVTDFAAEQVTDVVENQWEQSAEKAVDAAFRDRAAKKSSPKEEGRGNAENLTPEERVGKRVAETLAREAKAQNESLEDTLYRDIMVYANDKVRNTKEPSSAKQTRNLDALRDYYRYRSFFQDAWDAARSRVEQSMQQMPESDPRLPVLESFLQGDDSILRREYGDPQSPVRKAVKEAASEAGVRVDNHIERQQQARQKMRDVLIENAQGKQDALEKITAIAMQDLNLDIDAANEMARDIAQAFYNDLADQSARRLASMFGERASSAKVEKTMSQKLAELFNMGAFSSDQYRTAAFDSIFGEDSGVEIPDSLLEKLANANADQKAEVEQAIYTAAASQIKATPLEKWNAWRYMAMMANVKTNARNLAGNAMYMPYTEAKRVVGTIIERAVLKQDQRTKALLNPASQSDKALLSWAKADSSSGQAADALKYSAKLGDDVSAQKIDEQRRIFDSDILEKVRKVSEYLPAQGDMLFKNHEYAVSLAGFLKARGYTAADIESGKVSASVMTEARTYAINEAMRATFNDSNAFSDLMATAFRYKGNNPIGIAANALGEGIMPFRRTPANVLARAFENSPLGLLKTANDIRHNLTDGSVSAATIIDDVAANLTGTTAMALGYLLASGFAGIKLRGSDVDDEEKRRGHQEYAIEFSIGGKEYSYTIDWAAPANLPLFVGANLYSALEGSGKDASYSTFTAMVRALGLSFEPMLSLSCMSSLNDLIEAGKYSDGNALYSLAAQAATSYLTQGIPSLVRQAYQATQKNKQSTFANSEDPLLRGIQRKTAGVPFLGAAFQTDKVDEWGQTESTGSIPERIFNAYFNVGTMKTIDNSPLEQEIARLNNVQPDSVSPPTAAKTITYTDSNGESHKNQRLTEEQYNTLATVQGQTARNILDEALDSSIYQSMTDEQKAKVFDYTYAYARELGRTEAINGYQGMDTWMEAAGENPTKAILDKVVKAGFDDAFDSLTHAWEYDKDPASAVSALEDAYSVYSGMDKESQKEFKENTGGKVGYFLDAKDAGIDGETFTELYKTYSDIDAQDSDASAKARNWAYYLNKEKAAGNITAAQEAKLKDSMAYYNIFPADAGKFNGLTEAGLSADTAQKVVKLMDGITGTGKDGYVRDIDKYTAIAGSGLSEKDKETALLEYAPDAMDDKYNYAKKNMTKNGKGITIDDFVRAYQVTDRHSKKKEQTDAWRAMGYTEAEAENLYKLYKGKFT